MEPGLQRHPYALISPPRPMRPWPNLCHNYLAAHRVWIKMFNIVTKINKTKKFKKNYSIFQEAKRSADSKNSQKSKIIKTKNRNKCWRGVKATGFSNYSASPVWRESVKITVSWFWHEKSHRRNRWSAFAFLSATSVTLPQLGRDGFSLTNGMLFQQNP